MVAHVEIVAHGPLINSRNDENSEQIADKTEGIYVVWVCGQRQTMMRPNLVKKIL